MPLLTDNGKYAVINFGQVWQPEMPVNPGAIGQDDEQQLLWGFPEIPWGAFVPPVVVTAYVPYRLQDNVLGMKSFADYKRWM